MTRGLAIACTILAIACSHDFVGRTVSGRDPNRPERTALQRSATDLTCPPEELVLTPIGGSAYQVAGCGRELTYICVPIDGHWRYACTPEAPRVVTQAVAPTYVTVEAPPPATTAAPPSGPEAAAARAAIDAHASGVLACSGNAAVAVDGSWDASGALSVSVVGHAGTPEEECVRVALAGTMVSPAGAGGRVMHPIEPR